MMIGIIPCSSSSSMPSAQHAPAFSSLTCSAPSCGGTCTACMMWHGVAGEENQPSVACSMGDVVPACQGGNYSALLAKPAMGRLAEASVSRPATCLPSSGFGLLPAGVFGGWEGSSADALIRYANPFMYSVMELFASAGM